MDKQNTEDAVWEYMYGQIAKIVGECGPRASCSAEEKKAAGIIKKDMESNCNDVREESFTTHPRAFHDWPRFAACTCLLSVGIYLSSSFGLSKIFSSTLAILVMLFMCYAIWRQFFNYDEFIERFVPYKKGTSQNVYGVFHSPKPPKKRVIFAGHYDSAFRFNLIDKTNVGYAYFIVGGVGYLISFAVVFVVTLILEIAQAEGTSFLTFLFWLLMILNWGYCGIILIGGKFNFLYGGALAHPSFRTVELILGCTIGALFVQLLLKSWVLNGITPEKLIVLALIMGLPFLIALFFFLGSKAGPGVIDNLSAVGVCFGIAQTLKNYPNPALLEETEIVVLFTGSEEAGDRGAQAFAAKHAAEYNQIETTVVNLESFSDSNMQKIEIAEETTRVKCDPMVIKLLSEGAQELGITYKLQALPGISGGTDVAHFIKGGFRTSGLEGIRYTDYLYWYHTDRDDLNLIHLDKRPDADNGQDYRSLNVRGAMMNAYRICMKYIEKFATRN